MRTAVGIVAMAMAMAMIRALPRVNAKDRDVCEMRSDLVARVVRQRDKGVSKAEIEKAMAKAIPQFSSWLVDFISDHPDFSAAQIAAKDLDLCLKTP